MLSIPITFPCVVWQNFEQVRLITCHKGAISGMEIMGKVLVTVCFDKLVRCFDLEVDTDVLAYTHEEHWLIAVFPGTWHRNWTCFKCTVVILQWFSLLWLTMMWWVVTKAFWQIRRASRSLPISFLPYVPSLTLPHADFLTFQVLPWQLRSFPDLHRWQGWIGASHHSQSHQIPPV